MGAVIRATSRVMGVIGDPVAHSVSPAMHNAAIAALGLDAVYVAFHVRLENVGAAVGGVRGLGLLGLNVTIPHKLSVMAHLDLISEEALAIGAVNTIHNEDGSLTGYNTDVYGVTTAIERVAGVTTFPKRCVVLGAGGASRAVTYALASRGEVEHVTILNRTVDRAAALAEDTAKTTGKTVTAGAMTSRAQADAFAEAGLVVNATSLGMHPNTDASPLLAPDAVHKNLVLYDTVFNPLETRLMREFASRGAKAFGGLDMLVFQGARSFEIWTGKVPPTDVMKQAALGRMMDGAAGRTVRGAWESSPQD